MPVSLPGHGFSGEELQLVVVQTEAGERDEAGKGLRVQVVQIVVTETKPFDVLQALKTQKVSLSMDFQKKIGDISVRQMAVTVYLKGHVGDVDQLVVCE